MDSALKDSFTEQKQNLKGTLSRQNTDTNSQDYCGLDNHKASILRTTSRLSIRKKTDAAGIEFEPKGRDHKVSFKENLCEIKEVENWKSYNSEEGMMDKSCCQLF